MAYSKRSIGPPVRGCACDIPETRDSTPRSYALMKQSSLEENCW